MTEEHTYENTRRVVYGDGMTFIPVCVNCGRYVRAYDFVRYNDFVGLKDEPNADCSKCSPTKMPFEGWI